MQTKRNLNDLDGIGPAMMDDFNLLGVRSVEQLSEEDPQELYDRLCSLRGQRIDPCCLDVFRCAVEQARNPGLEPEKRQWWYWSRVRKANAGSLSR
jgi:nucleotidyltransferase/DNA polymerase involved in DNA repair